MTRKTLTQDDVARLLTDPSAQTRAETAAKIAQDFGADRLTPEEREMAQEIFRIMAKDAEVRVREALSFNLKENSAIPHEVAKAFAQDVDLVALPILQFSEVLTDEDLIEARTPASRPPSPSAPRYRRAYRRPWSTLVTKTSLSI